MYHNLRFKEEAEKRALIISKHSVYGYTLTEPSDQLMGWCKEQELHNIDLVRIDTNDSTGKGDNGAKGDGYGKDAGNGDDRHKRKSSTRKYQCPNCNLSVRATRTVRIQCMDCKKQMEEISR